MIILLKWVCRLNVIVNRNPKQDLEDMYKLILRQIWKGKGNREAKTMLEKENNVAKSRNTMLRHCMAIVTETSRKLDT